jgi:hypothetical protein
VVAVASSEFITAHTVLGLAGGERIADALDPGCKASDAYAASALRPSALMLGIRHCPGFQCAKVCRGVDPSPRIARRTSARDPYQADENRISGSRILNCLNLCIGDLIAAIREPDRRSRTGNKGAVWTVPQPLLYSCNLAAYASTLSNRKQLCARGNWPNENYPGEHGSQYIRPHIMALLAGISPDSRFVIVTGCGREKKSARSNRLSRDGNGILPPGSCFGSGEALPQELGSSEGDGQATMSHGSAFVSRHLVSWSTLRIFRAKAAARWQDAVAVA